MSIGKNKQWETEGSVNDVKSELGFFRVQEYDNNGVLEECKTVEVEMYSVTEEKKKTLLEVKKKQLLAKVEAGSLFKDKNNVENSLNFHTITGILEGLKGIDDSVKYRLKVEVIDDIVLIGTVTLAKIGNDGVKNAERHVNKNKKYPIERRKNGQEIRQNGDVQFYLKAI